MKYKDIKKGIFLERPNRFIANVLVDNKEVKCHVKNTGRCKELLVPGAELILEDFFGRMGARKTRYSVVSVYRKSDMETKLINMDSQAPNQVVDEALHTGSIRLAGMQELTVIKREKTLGDSRFDLYVEDVLGRKAYIEVKGVTLEREGKALFPDAPTERGLKHIKGLINAKEKGYYSYIIFLIQMNGVSSFSPNIKTHPEFAKALKEAKNAGVEILAYDSVVTERTLEVSEPVKVIL